MKIGMRIVTGFTTMLLILIAIAGYAYFAIHRVESINQNATEKLRAGAMLGERENDHLAWAALLSESILSGERFKGELDPTRCALGRWYSTYISSPEFKSQSPRFQELLFALNEPHRQLHQSAQEIEKLLDEFLPESDGTESSGAYDMATSATRPIPEEILTRVREIYDLRARKHLAEVRSILNEAHDILSKEAESLAENSKRQTGRTVRNIILFSILAVTFALVISWIISRGILVPLRRVLMMFKDISEGDGDLRKRLRVMSKDELGELATRFNMFVEKLQRIMHTVANAAGEVASTSSGLLQHVSSSRSLTDQISEAVQQVATGAQEQSTDLVNSASAVERLSRTILTVADGAGAQMNSMQKAQDITQEMHKSLDGVLDMLQQVGKASRENAESAVRGKAMAGNVMAGMDRIMTATQEVTSSIKELDEHSREIGNILEVIDEISEQTNLLAINAAIEAAKAGEHGRGFAVVADEVRKLAERSSKGTKAIANLVERVTQAISSSVDSMDTASKEVQAGSLLARDAGRMLEEISAAASEAEKLVTGLMDSSRALKEASSNVARAMGEAVDIARRNTTASEEMTRGAEEVKKALDSIAAVSEENAAASEEVSASTEEMNASIQEMLASIEVLARMAQDLQEAVNRFKI